MSPPEPRIDDTEVVERFTEALMQRVGAERFQMWFGSQVRFEHVAATSQENPEADQPELMAVIVGGQFALDRLKKNYMSEMRGAAATVTPGMRVELRCEPVVARQTELPLNETSTEAPTSAKRSSTQKTIGQHDAGQRSRRVPTPAAAPFDRRSRSKGVRSIQNLADQAVLGQTRSGASRLDIRHQQAARAEQVASQRQHFDPQHADQRSQTPHDPTTPAPLPPASSPSSAPDDGQVHGRRPVSMTVENFIVGPCNTLAHTAAMMFCNDPGANGLVYLSGPSGTGKSHLLAATGDYLRRRYRMRGVIHMSAEQFTNEFIAVVNKTGITDFRSRYRDVDALLIDDVHFFAKKKATIREVIHTLGEIQRAGKLMMFAGNASPHDVDGLSSELAGRLSSGLVCSMQSLDRETRKRLMLRLIQTRCTLAIDEKTIDQINEAMIGDGRAISGVVNVINLMQRMHHRTPTFAEIRQHCGHLLRGAGGEITLSSIEVAVADAFGLEDGALRSGSQTRRVAQPRMLAMYLSRQKTSSAYTEIAKHFNVKSHSTAIAAEKNVGTWLNKETLIGRGAAAVPAAEAIARVERLLTG